MRIFSNFDTKFRQKVLARQQELFWSENILVLTRSKYHFYFRVLAHLPLYIIMYVSLFASIFYIFDSYEFLILLFATVIVLFIFWLRIWHRILKYLYDFTIITPKTIFTYKQKGILYSVMKEIPADRIRSIQVSRDSILQNVFSYGSISIHADYAENPHIEEDNESAFVIGLSYVDDPLKAKNRISDICFNK